MVCTNSHGDTSDTSDTSDTNLNHRGDYWQAAYVIPKGQYQQVRDAGLEQLKHHLAELLPNFAEHASELTSWEQIKLLSVNANRLRRWYRPGLLCIGDAAHAMSPLGGVSINLALQDAVVAANVLAKPLQTNQLQVRHLRAIQFHETSIRIIFYYDEILTCGGKWEMQKARWEGNQCRARTSHRPYYGRACQADTSA